MIEIYDGQEIDKTINIGKADTGGGQMLDTYNQQIQDEISCTIRTNINTANHHFVVMEEPKVINPLKGQSDNGWHFEQQVYDAEGIARAVKAGEGSGNIPKVIVYDDYNQNIPKNQSVIGTITTNIGSSTPRNGIKLIEVFEPISVAMRGRNPNNPSERGKSNGNYKQRLEMNESGVANTITSVQKDSMVAEPMCSVHPNSHKFEFDPETSIKPISPALRATDYKAPHCVYEPQVEQIGNIVDDTNIGFKNPQRGRIYSDEGLAPCLNCCEGGGLEPKIVEDWQTVVGNKQLNPFRGSVEGTSPCITSACGAGGGMTPMLTDADLETTKTKEFIEQVRGHEEMRYRIRKLTPRECFRLMGVDDVDIDKIQASGISNSQQYKCAGNSIVVDVLYHIFRKMFCETENENDQLTLF